MKVLLDENFPLGLLHALRAEGFTADHIITLGWRGASDGVIRERMQGEQALFLTQDTEFLFAGPSAFAIVVVSRVRQSRPIVDRIFGRHQAVRDLSAAPQAERLFELSDEGALIPVTSSG